MYITTGKQYNELYNFAICFQCILTPNNSRVYIVNCVHLIIPAGSQRHRDMPVPPETTDSTYTISSREYQNVVCVA